MSDMELRKAIEIDASVRVVFRALTDTKGLSGGRTSAFEFLDISLAIDSFDQKLIAG
ncbi:MAG TPA: hypothetical protein VGE97_08100 [Nitrososphaera sp.]|jgi:hypothetical protein